MGPALCQKHLLDSLGLSPEQAEHVAIAQDALMSDIAALRAELATERSKLGGLLTTELPDESAIQAQLDRMSAVQRRVQARIVTHLLEQRQQLTPEQRVDYDELIRQRVCPCDGAGADMPCKMHRDGRDAVNEPIDP
jgi:Spy/CpxP family protein refolding chaperone